MAYVFKAIKYLNAILNTSTFKNGLVKRSYGKFSPLPVYLYGLVVTDSQILQEVNISKCIWDSVDLFIFLNREAFTITSSSNVFSFMYTMGVFGLRFCTFSIFGKERVICG
ncbi:hypothetical protein ILYODFUR_029517 [Ilyodon furcidens]|uniref:Uncharacterized protein n=1 Tax=Ilyodon furcidens TaxID=33524 RepID=A0ABV0STB7_9TELE